MKSRTIIILSVGALIGAIILYYIYKYFTSNRLFKSKVKTPTTSGYELDYINFDNAASTCPFQSVCNHTDEFLRYYSNTHRSSGFASKLSSFAFDKTRERILDFVGAGTNNESKSDYSSYNNDDERNTNNMRNNIQYVCIFGKNTSECFNKLSHSFLDCPEKRRTSLIITTKMEHHSNMLPWRRGNVAYIDTYPDGSLKINEDDTSNMDKYNSKSKMNEGSLISLIKRFRGKYNIPLITISGASNVTGIVNDIKTISDIAHSIGAFLCVDGAQLVPHKKVNMREMGIDFMCFSAHKMYAPFGVGVLIGREDYFKSKIGAPCMQGGGEVKLVTMDNVIWKESPEKDEEGTQNIPGVIALGEAIKELEKIGMENVEKHEKELYSKAYKCMNKINRELKCHDINVISPEPSQYNNQDNEITSNSSNPDNNSVNILSFYVIGLHPNLVSAILGDEFGIGSRSGCFCAHPYVTKLLGVDDEYIKGVENDILNDDYRSMTGFVRISFSLQNTLDEIDRLYDAMKTIVKNKEYYRQIYTQKKSGEFIRKDGKRIDTEEMFRKYLDI
jgi:cysteine desulfurase / selenocysteine lyase